jgi:hypothetical protein
MRKMMMERVACTRAALLSRHRCDGFTRHTAVALPASSLMLPVPAHRLQLLLARVLEL